MLSYAGIFMAALLANASAAPQVRIPVTMASTVDSATAKVGDTFTFRTTQTVQDGGITIPSGTLGHGTVTAVSPAAGTHRGSLEIVPQYLELSNGRRIAVAPATPKDASLSRASARLSVPLAASRRVHHRGNRQPRRQREGRAGHGLYGDGPALAESLLIY